MVHHDFTDFSRPGYQNKARLTALTNIIKLPWVRRCVSARSPTRFVLALRQIGHHHLGKQFQESTINYSFAQAPFLLLPVPCSRKQTRSSPIKTTLSLSFAHSTSEESEYRHFRGNVLPKSNERRNMYVWRWSDGIGWRPVEFQHYVGGAKKEWSLTIKASMTATDRRGAEAVKNKASPSHTYTTVSRACCWGSLMSCAN